MKLLLETDNTLRLIADSAIGRNLQPWFLPDSGENWRGRFALGFRVGKLGKNVPPKFAPRHFDAMTLIWVPEADRFDCLDFMDGAVVCGKWLPIEQLPDRAADLLAKTSAWSTMKTGDIIAYTLPVPATPININQHISNTLNNEEVLNFNIK